MCKCASLSGLKSADSLSENVIARTPPADEAIGILLIIKRLLRFARNDKVVFFLFSDRLQRLCSAINQGMKAHRVSQSPRTLRQFIKLQIVATECGDSVAPSMFS